MALEIVRDINTRRTHFLHPDGKPLCGVPTAAYDGVQRDLPSCHDCRSWAHWVTTWNAPTGVEKR